MLIVLPHIKAQRANLQQTPYLISPVPVFAAVMLGHAIASRLGVKDQGVGIIHHRTDPHIEYLPGTNGWQAPYPCQFRSATGDLASGGEGPIQNTLQPAVTGDIEISLILEVDNSVGMEDVRRVIKKMRMRLAGGTVPRLPDQHEFDHLGDAVRKCGRGFWVSDATDLVQKRISPGVAEDGSPIEGDHIIDAVMGRQEAGWHAPATLGYRALSRFEPRTGARSGPDGQSIDHAYGEALVGLVRFSSIFSHTWEGPDAPKLWSYEWINPTSFVVKQ